MLDERLEAILEAFWAVAMAARPRKATIEKRMSSVKQDGSE